MARAERRALLAWRTPERNAPGPLVEFTPRQGDAIDRGDEETRLADFPFLPSGLVRGKTLLGIQRSPTLFPTTLSTQHTGSNEHYSVIQNAAKLLSRAFLSISIQFLDRSEKEYPNAGSMKNHRFRIDGKVYRSDTSSL